VQLEAPGADPTPPCLFDSDGKRWIRITSLTTRQIREVTKPENCLSRTKVFNMTEYNAKQLYQKLSRLKSIPNRAKLYRLLHGDVYCMARAYRFGLTDSDRCVRCFNEGTITHVLLECPYTKEVWSRLGVPHNRPEDVLHGNITAAELEIRAELIVALVFRMKTIPPDVLIKVTLDAYNKGLSRSVKTKQLAESMLARHQIAGQWYW